ncbi:4-hydroxy-3-methylbut-2-enyl diphosphate reductase [Brevinema andersonii]|uniref:4-hydroxy-3-methylbut-2-enyl diphosphate reductase n=1 Tax=Brevinema andersonii TaxID=34097 RepID=A0A1I1DFT4_BREAD|nr:4-hydroxy-3-methylbut-2-enyl diphosphate reductase [Brevinema andersonii]SFB73801.1 4-hydroxy-3-methylbut-2-enyl diphosphate reductase [Brevinema andersonii]
MKVIIPKTSGFCPGVRRAEKGVLKLKETHTEVHLHGPLIHNQSYIERLESLDIKAVDTETLPENSTLVIRTHGIPRGEEMLLMKKFHLEDMTCPIVKRVQKHVEKASQEQAFVIISGKENHAEVQGVKSYADHAVVIQNKEELAAFLANGDHAIPPDTKKIFILSQTTHSRSFFEYLYQQVTEFFKDRFPIEIKDTICPITEDKEKESLILQKDSDFTIVIGDPHSSNSKKLYTILKEADNNTIFVRNLDDLNNQKTDWQNINTVLVVSSTSTPQFIEQEIVRYLEAL